MAQDIRSMFKEDTKVSKQKMPKGHESRFLKKLDHSLPVNSKRNYRIWLNRAASIVILLGITVVAIQFFQNSEINNPVQEKVVSTKSLGEISPELKKVEDYYMASINTELANINYSPESKELFDGFVDRLEELSNEYNLLAAELVNSGPNEDVVTALIDNLKLRLNLLYRLKEKLNEINTQNAYNEITS